MFLSINIFLIFTFSVFYHFFYLSTTIKGKLRGISSFAFAITQIAIVTKSRKIQIVVPTHFSGGGTIYSNGFFYQIILADRYNHRREL